MIYLTSQSRILLGIEPADFRMGIDGFSARCRLHLGANPQSGALFVFINRNKTMIRALRFDGTGFWLMTKRLSKGKFQQWPSPKHPKLHSVTAVYLRALLSGDEATYINIVK
jgi:transposase